MSEHIEEMIEEELLDEEQANLILARCDCFKRTGKYTPILGPIEPGLPQILEKAKADGTFQNGDKELIEVLKFFYPKKSSENLDKLMKTEMTLLVMLILEK